jgi:hypothetical protein
MKLLCICILATVAGRNRFPILSTNKLVVATCNSLIVDQLARLSYLTPLSKNHRLSLIRPRVKQVEKVIVKQTPYMGDVDVDNTRLAHNPTTLVKQVEKMIAKQTPYMGDVHVSDAFLAHSIIALVEEALEANNNNSTNNDTCTPVYNGIHKYQHIY